MPRVLLVDGYNVIGAWPRLIKLRDRGDWAGAREKLLHELVEFSHVQGWRVVVVFDAYATPTIGVQEFHHTTVEVYYTSEMQTADTFIERHSLELLRQGHEKVWVATSDRVQQLVVQAQGTHLWSADRLVQEIHKSKHEQKLYQQEKSARQGRLGDRIDPQVRAKLLNWHQK